MLARRVEGRVCGQNGNGLSVMWYRTRMATNSTSPIRFALNPFATRASLRYPDCTSDLTAGFPAFACSCTRFRACQSKPANTASAGVAYPRLLCRSAGCAYLLDARSAPVLAADKPGATPASGWTAGPPHAISTIARLLAGLGSRQEDHGTMCVSCHTSHLRPGAPALRSPLGENGPTDPERPCSPALKNGLPVEGDGSVLQRRHFGPARKSNRATLSGAQLHHSSATIAPRPSGRHHAHRVAMRGAAIHVGPTAGAWVWQNFHYTPWITRIGIHAPLWHRRGNAPITIVTTEDRGQSRGYWLPEEPL